MVTEDPERALRPKPKLFIDSGAYSAETKGAHISVYQYLSFLKRWKPYLDVICGLDVIGNAEATWHNQKVMEDWGQEPIPTFHFGEDYKWLVKYVERYSHMALGGQVGQSTEQLIKWLDEVWDQYLTNDEGLPIVKVHAFGVTSPDIMNRYPWHSVDSTSWLLAAATGKAILCDKDPLGFPWLRPLAVSDKSPDAGRDQHWDSLTPANRKGWGDLFEQKGYDIRELQTDYKVRFFCNAQAYVDFAKHTSSYKPFVAPMMGLFPSSKAFPRRVAQPEWPHLNMYLAGNPGASNITRGLMEKGYNRLLSYHYIAESMSHFNEAREVKDKWQSTPSSAMT